jgi:hypothetical protein
MLTPKFKRSPPTIRPTRFDDAAEEHEASAWSGQTLAPPMDLVEAALDGPRVRLLRTQDDKPTAPKIKDLFPRETRSIDRVITFWDPGNSWPSNALADVATPGAPEYGAVRLVHTDGQRSFALIRHLCVEDEQGQLCAVLHVEASTADLASADVALMLLERSDYAVVLTGSAEHRDLPRRLQDFCRQAAWRGPTLQFISPPDKPGRADRLRKISWPRSLRVQVLELAPLTSPGWLVGVLEKVAEGMRFPALPRAAEDAAARQQAASDGADLPPPRKPSEPLPERPSATRCTQALQVAAIAPGLAGAAVIDFYTQTALARQGDAKPTDVGVRTALQRWHAETEHGDPQALDELAWAQGALHHIVLQVPEHPGLLLLGVVDAAAGDVSRSRWQLGVASNEFA